MCNRFFAGRLLRTHKQKCAAGHPNQWGPGAGGQAWWEYSADLGPLEVKNLLNDVNRELIDEISWEKLAKYWFASQTLTVPWACRSEWHSAFALPLYLWKEGFTEDSLKLHYTMIQSICALMPVKVQYG